MGHFENCYTGNMDTSRRRWSWTAFATGLAVGIPLGVVGLIVLLQILTVMISP